MFEGSANDYRLNYLMEHEILAAFDRPSCIKFVKPENADEDVYKRQGENVWLESNARPITGMENFVTYTKRY